MRVSMVSIVSRIDTLLIRMELYAQNLPRLL